MLNLPPPGLATWHRCFTDFFLFFLFFFVFFMVCLFLIDCLSYCLRISHGNYKKSMGYQESNFGELQVMIWGYSIRMMNYKYLQNLVEWTFHGLTVFVVIVAGVAIDKCRRWF